MTNSKTTTRTDDSQDLDRAASIARLAVRAAILAAGIAIIAASFSVTYAAFAKDVLETIPLLFAAIGAGIGVWMLVHAFRQWPHATPKRSI